LDSDHEKFAERQAIQAESPDTTVSIEQFAKIKAKLGVTLMSDVKPETTTWLWDGRIPNGKVTVIEGDPGVGKSFVTCAIAASVSVGEGLPGNPSADPANVVMMNAEDGVADTIHSRLQSVGAELSRVITIQKHLSLDKAGCRDLHVVLEQYKPRLLVIDPLFADTPSGTNIYKDDQIRAVMDLLAKLAAHHRCAIVLVRHLNKSAKDRSIYRGGGSIAITAAARSVLLVGLDAADKHRRAVTQIKNNLGPMAKSIGYTINDGVFSWTGESDLTADDILQSDQAASDALPISEAISFLEVSLANGPVLQKVVLQQAKQVGLTNRTVYRAKAKLHVESKKGGFDGNWMWQLPEDCHQDGHEF
jgi:hypothetical protein